MSEVNLFDVEVEDDADDPDGYHTSYARIGPLVGGRQLGLSVYELRRDRASARTTTRSAFEEWLIVLDGTADAAHAGGRAGAARRGTSRSSRTARPARTR